MTATPWGFRDILPEEAQAREEIALTVKGCFREHHYLPVETPLLEDKGSLEEGGRIADTPFKLFDDDGRLLVVRPDNTLPIVRLVSTRMRAADLPLRLRYEAPVVRECQRNAGGSRQFTQLGFELIGAGDTAGDVEIVSLVAEAVRKLALPDARIIAGSVRPFKELLAACEDRELAAEASALRARQRLCGPRCPRGGKRRARGRQGRRQRAAAPAWWGRGARSRGCAAGGGRYCRAADARTACPG